MYLVKLPEKIASGDNKGEPNIVDIKSAKLTDSTGKNYQFKIPAQDFQYPQFGPEPSFKTEGEGDKARQVEIPLSEEQAQSGVDEAIKDAGGVIRFLENYNQATRTAALNTGKNYIRTKETGDPGEIVKSGLKLSAEFSWAKAERLTAKEVKEETEKLVDEIDNLSPDEVKARLKAMFGK